MSTLTDDEIFLIHQRLHGMHLPVGLGTEESACSIAAINLALTGRLTDKIPDCMSEVVGRWIIRVQDAMPDEMRNSDRWKNLLPLAAGTGREHESERLEIIMDWMWGTVLSTLQPLADAEGFGAEWRRMTEDRSAEAAAAARVAMAAEEAARATTATTATTTAAWAAAAAAWAAAAAAEVVWPAEEAAWAAVAAAQAAEDAAWAAATAAAAEQAAWETFDPCAVLQKLVEVGE